MTQTTSELGPTVEAVLKESRRITPDSTDEVRHLVLYVDDPAFRFVEGQSIGVVVRGPHPFGNVDHVRRYSIANARDVPVGEGIDIELLVRRCFYLDEVSGERYPGIASNYLCDAKPGDHITIAGPFRSPFKMPMDNRANLLMLGTGTGVAPFRAFSQYIYERHKDWKGKVRLFYGARTGLEMLYMNDEAGDLANYMSEATFKAFKGLAGRPLAPDEKGLEHSLKENLEEAWDLLHDPMTYVYVAGLGKVAHALDAVMEERAGSAEAWAALKGKLIDEGRWSELIYN